jgi:hypothetical protein
MTMAEIMAKIQARKIKDTEALMKVASPDLAKSLGIYEAGQIQCLLEVAGALSEASDAAAVVKAMTSAQG